MRTRRPAARHRARTAVVAMIALSLLAACGSSRPLVAATPNTPATSATTRPDWFDIRMTDVQTGQTFAISDFAGKIVLVEAMAEWCPTCVEQQREVKKLHDLLATSKDVVSISLDIDVHEDGPSLAGAGCDRKSGIDSV